VDPQHKAGGDELRNRQIVSCPADSFGTEGFARLPDQPPGLNRTAVDLIRASMQKNPWAPPTPSKGLGPLHPVTFQRRNLSLTTLTLTKKLIYFLDRVVGALSLEEKMENKKIETGHCSALFISEWKNALLILIMSLIIIIDFSRNGDGFHLSTNTLIAISILVILVLAKSFNKLAVGKLLIVEGNLRKTEIEKEKVEARNDELIKNFVALSANINLANSNRVSVNFPHINPENLGVMKADNIDIDGKNSDDICMNDNSESKTEEKITPEERKIREILLDRRLRWGMYRLAIKKFSTENNFNEERIITDVRFTAAFQALDPIMERPVLFDGYYNDMEREVFIRTILSYPNSIMSLDRLYLNLSKIFFYNQAKNVRSTLALLLVELPEKDNEGRHYPLGNRLNEYFRPALNNGILRIHTIKFSDEDISQAKKMGEEMHRDRTEM
jgi:hypothetical protein